jgi:aspartate kinase
MLVQKFGGTSVASVERIKRVAQIVANAEAEKKLVVVSAMAGMTDQLVSYTRELGPLMRQDNFAEYDTIISAGEQITIGLLALALQSLGLKARSYLAWQVPIVTNNHHSKAKINEIFLEKLLLDLSQGIIPIVAGFQGLSEGRVTTLGRGGSDTSAVALAAALKADSCDIYTDVDGIYNVDPRLVPKAGKIEALDYDTCLEMASSGAKVIHPRAVALAKDYGIKIRILNSFSNNPGTLITKMEKTVIKAITVQKNLAQITIFALEREEMNKIVREILPIIDSIQEGQIRFSEDQRVLCDYTLLVSDENLPQVEALLTGKDLTKRERLSKVVLLGYALREEPGLIDSLLSKVTNPLTINNCDNRIEILLEESQVNKLVREIPH